jgi:hypothetical protein
VPALEAEIQVAGLAERIDTFCVRMQQLTDQLGRPSAQVRTWPLLLTLTGLAATRDFFVQWAIDSHMRRSGWLVVYERDQARWRLAFYDAYCVLHDTLFQPGRGLAAYELTLALSPAAVDLNGVHSEIHSDLWWEKKGDVRFRALTKPAELLSGPGVRSWPAERPPTPPQVLLPSPELSALTGAPLAPKPPKIALDPKKKPLYAPTIAKWYKKGGAIEVLDNGNWKFTDWEHNSVVYEGDEPNYDKYARQKVDIEDMTGDCTTDFAAANKAAPLGRILADNTWHHKQNAQTMQEVERRIHDRFTHYGARHVLKKRKAQSAQAAPTKLTKRPRPS